MKLITIDETNIENEHICCALAGKKGDTREQSKKTWMKERFPEGLTFQRADARGKAFIEYLPAENAWCPLEAEGYMHINCFWVAGQFKGQGIGSQLLEECVKKAKEEKRLGLTVLSSTKKKPYLSDPAYLKRKGFLVADTAAPFFELLYLPFEKDAPVPRFKNCAKQGTTQEQGLVLYYSNQCPHTAMYVPLFVEAAKERGIELTVHQWETAAQAQNAPSPFTTYSLFDDGAFVTNEILSEKKFTQILDSKQG